LTDYQRIAALHKMEPLGGRMPSELLASMLELCPRGHETSIFFTHLLLERLPAELRITLGEDDHPVWRVSGISGSSSRAERLPSTRTTSRWWGHWRGFLNPGRHASGAIWPTWLSLLRTFGTWQARIMWLLMHCRGLQTCLLLLPLLPARLW
jgi:hypothetical protein